MIDLILTTLKWYIGIGVLFLLFFELLFNTHKDEFMEMHPNEARELSWTERIATVLLWPYFLFRLFKG